MANDHLRWGTWNVICPVCGFKFKASQMRQRWDGLHVDVKCWEQRHPQEFLRSVPDNQSVPWTYPDGKVPRTDYQDLTTANTRVWYYANFTLPKDVT